MKKNNQYFTGCLMLSYFFCCNGIVLADNQDAELREQALSLFKPLDSATNAQESTANMIKLGRTLFFDKRISANGKVSCAQCHQPKFFGTRDPSSAKVTENSPHNVPTVLNVALNFANNWYGDQASVEEQAIFTLVSPSGLGHKDSGSAIKKIKSFPEYRKLFSGIFPNDPDPVTPVNWAAAIGAFERTLITPAPFDAYLAGNNKAISADAKKGLKKFSDNGCVACHNGIGIGGGSYQKFGVWEDYWPLTKSRNIDKGRFNETRDENDLYVFRVASLRNVKKTAPYFHDGSVKTLPEAVRIMGKIQLRKTLSAQDVKYIVAFLDTLTGKLPKSFSPPIRDNSVK